MLQLFTVDGIKVLAPSQADAVRIARSNAGPGTMSAAAARASSPSSANAVRSAVNGGVVATWHGQWAVR